MARSEPAPILKDLLEVVDTEIQRLRKKQQGLECQTPPLSPGETAALANIGRLLTTCLGKTDGSELRAMSTRDLRDLAALAQRELRDRAATS